jgi:ADP-ribose pyrophosphatase YjhB (NUDIX family)
MYSYEYPHPAVTVDVTVFTVRGGEVQVLLIKRAEWPHTGKWAIPGGFVEIDESLKRAALRELREETGVKAGVLEQLGAFGHPDRDPRERVITVVYISLLPFDRLHIEAGSDAADAQLFGVDALPELAFDHDRILRRARERLRDKLDIDDVAKLPRDAGADGGRQAGWSAPTGETLSRQGVVLAGDCQEYLALQEPRVDRVDLFLAPFAGLVDLFFAECLEQLGVVLQRIDQRDERLPVVGRDVGAFN